MEKEKLFELINSRISENEWLDYKQEWHGNKIKLIKDILAFTNTTHHKDYYLVFGVADKTFEVIGVDGDSNRRNTQQITDLLSQKKLSRVPTKIAVETVRCGAKEIDVLTVFNNSDVPIFYTRKSEYQGKKIHPGQIFTRVADTNTSYSETASDANIEGLYRKKMRLDLTIYERYRYLMEQVIDWIYIDLENKLLYNFNPD